MADITTVSVEENDEVIIFGNDYPANKIVEKFLMKLLREFQNGLKRFIRDRYFTRSTLQHATDYHIMNCNI